MEQTTPQVSTESSLELEERKEENKQRVLQYANDIISGKILANRWIYAAIRRFHNDLEREDIYFDWDELTRLNDHFLSLSLVGEYSGKPFVLQDWQLFTYGNLMCWKWTESNTRRFKIGICEIARGAGKSSCAAALCLYDLRYGVGKRVNILANNQSQADLILTTAKTMVERMDPNLHDFSLLYQTIISKDRDCELESLAANEKSCDGRSPSFAVSDETAEYRGRILTKLITSLGKRKESTLLITTTPGHNSENHYYEFVKNAQTILTGETQDDTIFAMLYGLDKEDALDDTNVWIKANPGMEYGQPDISSLKRAWNTMKQSPMGRAEFARYHACRFSDDIGGWLDMALWDDMNQEQIDEETLDGKSCYLALDLSLSGDMTALVACFPLENGKVFVKGRYFFPSDGLAQRSLDYRLPCLTWAKEGKIELSAGREIDYEQIRVACHEWNKKYDVKMISMDPWNSKMLSETLMNDGLPVQKYRMNISTFAPGCQILQNMWFGKKFLFNHDPVMRRACSEAVAKRDTVGNIRPSKPREKSIIDPLVALVMCCHSFGGTQSSIYEQEAELFNGDFNGNS